MLQLFTENKDEQKRNISLTKRKTDVNFPLIVGQQTVKRAWGEEIACVGKRGVQRRETEMVE